MAQKMNKGIFIALEGPEGSGKSTQSRRLFEELKADGYDVIHTSEPGDTPLGSRIRKILLENDHVRLDNEAELFLFEADRAQHIKEIIEPGLKDKKIIICDRFNTATFAYQGYALGMDMDVIKYVDNIATGGICPDITIILDIDVETGLIRAGNTGRADRMEQRGKEFHEKVRYGYNDIAEKNTDRIKIIKSKGNIDKIYDLVREQIYDLIERNKRAE